MAVKALLWRYVEKINSRGEHFFVQEDVYGGYVEAFGPLYGGEHASRKRLVAMCVRMNHRSSASDPVVEAVGREVGRNRCNEIMTGLSARR